MLKASFLFSLPLEYVLGFPDGADGKESACHAGNPGSIPGLRRSPGEGNGNLLHPVFSPGESHGQGSLTGCGPWGHKELDMTGRLTLEYV